MRLRASGSKLAMLDWLVTIDGLQAQVHHQHPATNHHTLACPTTAAATTAAKSAHPSAERIAPALVRQAACHLRNQCTESPPPAPPGQSVHHSVAKAAADSTSAMVANITLTEAKASALAVVRSRSAGWVRSRWPMERSTCT